MGSQNSKHLDSPTKLEKLNNISADLFEMTTTITTNKLIS